MGLFVLWWGWLAFNSGSTYGVSGAKWQYAARAAVMTMIGSFGGGISSMIFSIIKTDGGLDIIDLVNGVLASLVSVTGGCFLYRAWEALLIGAIGALLCCVMSPIFDRLGVDDPVGASAVHGTCGVWGVIAIGIFADNPIPLETTKGRYGLLKGGGWYLLGVQVLSAMCFISWGLCSTFALLYIIDKIVPIRMNANEELLGADLMEHRIRHTKVGLSRAISALVPLEVNNKAMNGIQFVKPIGINPGHERGVTEIRVSHRLQNWNSYHIKNNLSGRRTPSTIKRQTSLQILANTTKNTKNSSMYYDDSKDMKKKEKTNYLPFAWTE